MAVTVPAYLATRDALVDAIRDYDLLHGRPPLVMFVPQMMEWRLQRWSDEGELC